MKENILWYRHPAGCWTEALPLGNGSLGAMVFSDPNEERILLNHETLWSGYPRNYHNAEARKYLSVVRSCIRQDREYEAQRLMEEHMSGRFNESFLPMAEIRIQSRTPYLKNTYQRFLNLEDATLNWHYAESGGKREGQCFISHPRQMLVYILKGKNINLTVHMESMLRHRVRPMGNILYLEGTAPSHVEPHYWKCDEPVIYEENVAAQGMRFGVLLSAAVKSGTVCQEEERIRISGAEEVVLYVNADTSFQEYNIHPALHGKEFFRSAYARNRDARHMGYGDILEEHIGEYQKSYRRCNLELQGGHGSRLPLDRRQGRVQKGEADPGFAALVFNYGRYLLLSSSRKCKEPANLQGLWNKELRPYWSCNYTTNINLEMNYWPAETCNLAECTEPLFKLISELSEDGRKTADIHYGCGGWTAHHNVDIWKQAIPAGHENPVYGFATSLFWCMAGGWLCRHMWEHYCFGGDKDFLREKAKPLIEGAVDFFIDWLVRDETGKLTTVPATSPENSYLDKEGRRCSVSGGSAMDQEIIRDTFSYYLEMCKVLNCEDTEDRNRVNMVKGCLKKMWHPLQDYSGKLIEWEKERIPFEPGHRHHSPLYGLYPADLITEDQKEIISYYQRFLDWKIENHSSKFGWSLAWTLCLYARLKDKKSFEKQMQIFLKGSLYENLFTLHPPLSENEHEVFQIDAIMGYTAAVAECLLQSQNGKIELLPCLPDCWPAGRINGLRARGGFTIDIIWEKGLLERVKVGGGFLAKVCVCYGKLCREIEGGDKEIWLDGELQPI